MSEYTFTDNKNNTIIVRADGTVEIDEPEPFDVDSMIADAKRYLSPNFSVTSLQGTYVIYIMDIKVSIKFSGQENSRFLNIVCGFKPVKVHNMQCNFDGT